MAELKSVGREALVEDPLHGRNVQLVRRREERLHEGRLAIILPHASDEACIGIALDPAAAQRPEIGPGLEHPLGRLARLPALLGNQSAHRREAGDRLVVVEPVAGRGATRLDDAVAALPDPDDRDAEAGAGRGLPDGVHGLSNIAGGQALTNHLHGWYCSAHPEQRVNNTPDRWLCATSTARGVPVRGSPIRHVLAVRHISAGRCRRGAVDRRELQPGGHRACGVACSTGRRSPMVPLTDGPSLSPGRPRAWAVRRRTPSRHSGRGSSSSAGTRIDWRPSAMPSWPSTARTASRSSWPTWARLGLSAPP